MFIYTPITTCIIKKLQMQSIQAPGIFKFMINSATKNNKIKDIPIMQIRHILIKDHI